MSVDQELDTRRETFAVPDSEHTRREFLRAMSREFNVEYPDDSWDFDRRLYEFDRCFGRYDGRTWVATCGAFGRELVVPGGVVPVAGVSMVTVAPTLRRQGLMAQMMRHQFADIHRRGEPVAMLWPSEAPIYGRYGYASAVPRIGLSAPTRALAFRPGVDLGRGLIEEVSKDEFAQHAPTVHSALVAGRPGGLLRPAIFWERELLDRPEDRGGAAPIRYLLHRGASGEIDGYARYRIVPGWADEAPDSRVEVIEIEAAAVSARAKLWRFLIDLDLVRSLEASVAVDEPLRHLVADTASLTTRVADSISVRLVDVAAALRARAYSADLDVVIDVRDAHLGHNNGRFRLVAAAGGPAEVSLHHGVDADLQVDVRELGAIYLGGVPLAALHRAGLVAELTPGAADRVGAAFAWHRAPFCADGL